MQDYNKAAPEERSKELLANSVEADNKPFLKHIRSRTPAGSAAVASVQSQRKEAQGTEKSVFCTDIHRQCLDEKIGVVASVNLLRAKSGKPTPVSPSVRVRSLYTRERRGSRTSPQLRLGCSSVGKLAEILPSGCE